MTLDQTATLMVSKDYKQRFIAEYWQTKIRYERLKALTTRIEAVRRANSYPNEIVEEPKYVCPKDMLEHQQHIMGEYLHLLEVRAVIEGINLEE